MLSDGTTHFNSSDQESLDPGVLMYREHISSGLWSLSFTLVLS